MGKRFIPALLFILSLTACAGEKPGLRVLPGISQGRLTIFPVIAGSVYDTSGFITLDEGIRSGRVVVTEGGRMQGLRRGRARRQPVADDVNRLWLANDSDKPLLLLAGELVSGGKQDRVVAKDRIVPPHGDPVDLSVFCVEPGRWTDQTASFGAVGGIMAAPKVRAEAMGAKDQQKVWDAVRASNETVEVVAEAPELNTTTSYIRANENAKVKQKMFELVDPIERSYRKVISDLAARNAVGVAVAVDGRMVWADIFASPQLLQAYWPKLIRSYVADVIGSGSGNALAHQSDAQAFVDQLQGRHETVDTEPGVFRHAETKGDGFRVFTLTALVPNTGFAMHIAKMAEERSKPVPLYR